MCGASVFERVEGVSVCGWLRHSLFELVDVALTAVLRVPQDGTFWVVDVFDPPSGSLVASAGVCLRDRPSSPKVPPAGSGRCGVCGGIPEVTRDLGWGRVCCCWVRFEVDFVGCYGAWG